MMCFRDQTYCSARCEPKAPCWRLVTPEIDEAAQRAGLPLALTDFHEACDLYRAPDSAGKETDRG